MNRLKGNIPRHIAIIMDGNGRWARERGLPRTAGHREGIKRVKEIIRSAAKFGIEVVTFFVFSAENWTRPQREIDMLMRSLVTFLRRQIRELGKKNIRFIVIGRDEPLPKYVQDEIRKAQAQTKDNDGMKVVLALNYGSRQEIVDAAKGFARLVAAGKVHPETMDIVTFSNFFYTVGLPDPDLLIRTGGEMRLSNFLLWQLSYAELYFTKKFWPDFGKNDFERAIREYQKRERRFGGVTA